MANEKSEQNPSQDASGQQKSHTATRTVNGVEETRDFTQQQWRERDKTEGWQRPEDTTTEGEV
jgi:hypothetical protein